jgi:uncharacterized membrane protein YphA (DoxX/SURF4 family)
MKTRTNVLLWIIQGLLAALFLFSGTMKFILPPSVMQQGPVKLPMAFLRFIGVMEILGALGLILPGITHIRVGLTPLAAAGLVIIMIGATVVTLMGNPVAAAILPFVTGVLAATVAYGRRPRQA